MEAMNAHMKAYPSCEHQGVMEEYFFLSCREDTTYCDRYLKAFPGGARKADVEEVLWQECQKGSCDNYSQLFPNGQHVAALRERDAERQRQDKAYEVSKEAERKARLALWSGPQTEVTFSVPDGASLEALDVKVLGQAAQAVCRGCSGEWSVTYALPAALRVVEVCYRKHCAELSIGPGPNDVPLSALHLVCGGSRWDYIHCMLGGMGGQSLDCENTIDIGTRAGAYVMPGDHLVECLVSGGRHADHARNAVVDGFGSIRVPFTAPASAGVVLVMVEIDGMKVRGSAVVQPTPSERWR